VREYEIMIIVRADLAEDDLNSQVETIKGWITAREGTVTEVVHWGRRRLAYPIARLQDGYYILFKTQLPSTAPIEIERTLRITEGILRYLVIRCDE
jgi:small subunit ribosomal protein S6